MSSAEDSNRKKEGIVATIGTKGPSLPVQIAKAIRVQPLFASAFLSELKAENRVKISNLRVGSSPLYYLDGQEKLLEGFVEYLNHREREAFFLLKKSNVLEDEKQVPIVRVALRAIKDFALPVKIRINGELKLFWKYFVLDDKEVAEIVRKSLDKRKEKLLPARPPELKKPEPETGKLKVEDKRQLDNVEKKIRKKEQETAFSRNVKDYLKGKDIEVLEVLSEKKKESEARIRIDTLFGKQEYYLIAKDKKSVTDNDFRMAWQRAQERKMPAALMSTGELNKKGREHFSDWKNLVKWERLRF